MPSPYSATLRPAMKVPVQVIYFLWLELFVKLELAVMDFESVFVLKHKSLLVFEYGVNGDIRLKLVLS